MVSYKLFSYSVSHWLVDFSCALLLFSQMKSLQDFALLLLVYNFCAFALQLPFGILADDINKNHIIAALGCMLVALAYPISIFPKLCFLTSIVLGVGNALFHLGGGIATLNHSDHKATALGIFVSPGAFGLYLGTLLGKNISSIYLLIAFPIILLIMGLILILLCPSNENIKLSFKCSHKVYFAIPLFLVVVLRSYIGFYQTLPWKSQWIWALIVTLSLVLGKTCGGILMDRFGIGLATLGTLSLAAVCYLFSDLPIIGTLAVFFFNMTMPITLWAMAKIFPGAKGFSFGLLTFALFLGYLPYSYGLPSVIPAQYLCPVASILSMILLWIPLKHIVKGAHNDN